MRKLNMVFLLLCFSIFLSGASTVLHAQNLCPNGSFEQIRPVSESTNPNGQCWNPVNGLAGNAPAQNWTTWMGCTLYNCCVFTEVVKATGNCVRSNLYVTGNMMHVTTTANNGIVNSSIVGGNKTVTATARVYVVKGRVKMGVGPTGSPVAEDTSIYNCRWEVLRVTGTNPAGVINQILFYGVGASEFYVGTVVVRAGTFLQSDDYESGATVTDNSMLQEKLPGLPDVIKIAPNPAVNMATAVYDIRSKFTTAKLEKTDITERTLQHIGIQEANGKATINVMPLANGMYTCTLYADRKRVASTKLVVNK